MVGTNQPFKQANNPFAQPSPVEDLESGSGLQALSLTQIDVNVEAGDGVPERPSGASDDVPDKPAGASDESKDWDEMSIPSVQPISTSLELQRPARHPAWCEVAAI